jgi:hypothetical protein
MEVHSLIPSVILLNFKRKTRQHGNSKLVYNTVQFSPLTEVSHYEDLVQASQSVAVLVGTQTHAISP